MRINSAVVLTTPRLCLVPYHDHHVQKYHAWMESPELQAATSSEPLTLEEEYEAQQRWSELDDRLTFILLDRELLNRMKYNADKPTCWKSIEIASMLGDINLFLTPRIEDPLGKETPLYEGELSVMLAEERARGKGLAAEALAAFLEYIGRHLPYKLCALVAKVSMDNGPSIRLFQGHLGFVERSRCNVFRQIEFVPPAECFPAVTDANFTYSDGTTNSSMLTSQWIIKRMALTRPEFRDSTWSYTETDLHSWRQGL